MQILNLIIFLICKTINVTRNPQIIQDMRIVPRNAHVQTIKNI